MICDHCGGVGALPRILGDPRPSLCSLCAVKASETPSHAIDQQEWR